MNRTEIKQKLKNFWVKVKAYAVKFGKAAFDYIKLAKIELIILAGVLAFDLITKAIMSNTIELNDAVTVIPNFLYFRNIRNYQAAFGSSFGMDKFLSLNAIRVIFLIITVIAIGFFSFFMYKFRNGPKLGRIIFALIIAGALGNFIDRLFLGYVRDFVEIVFFGLDLPLLGESFAIFNMADVSLVVGVIMFAIYFLFIYKPQKPEFVGPVQQFLNADGTYSPLKTNKEQLSNAKIETEGAGESTTAEESTVKEDDEEKVK